MSTPNSSRGYQVLKAEPGILIEIFMPKKSRFQGTLHEALRVGANLEAVKQHFLSQEPTVKNRIKELLEFHRVLADHSPSDIEKFHTVFRGYSMYEVDGVYYSEKEASNGEGKQLVEYEERTQIIKLIFLPEYGSGEERKRRIKIARAFLPLFSENVPDAGTLTFCPTDYKQSLSSYVRERIEAWFREEGSATKSTATGAVQVIQLTREDEQYILDLIFWVHCVALWVFGYLMFQVDRRIGELKTQYAPEEEIWITSQWDFVVNRLKL